MQGGVWGLGALGGFRVLGVGGWGLGVGVGGGFGGFGDFWFRVSGCLRCTVDLGVWVFGG